MNDMNVLLNMVERRKNITANIRFLSEAFTWQQLCQAGLRVEAMVRYRQDTNSRISDAYATVNKYCDQLENGEIMDKCHDAYESNKDTGVHFTAHREVNTRDDQVNESYGNVTQGG